MTSMYMQLRRTVYRFRPTGTRFCDKRIAFRFSLPLCRGKFTFFTPLLWDNFSYLTQLQNTFSQAQNPHKFIHLACAI